MNIDTALEQIEARVKARDHSDQRTIGESVTDEMENAIAVLAHGHDLAQKAVNLSWEAVHAVERIQARLDTLAKIQEVHDQRLLAVEARTSSHRGNSPW